MTAETQAKMNSKYDVKLEQEALRWMEAVLGEPLFAGVAGQDNVHEKLKDGTILCNLVNVIKPGSVKKVNQSKMAFKMMENIGLFLNACEGLGMNKSDLFQTVSLYEKTNMAQVIDTIHGLGRKASTHNPSIPGLGPKEASANKRAFTEEQMRAGDGVIGLQAGYNKGASQAGQNFGKTRSIID